MASGEGAELDEPSMVPEEGVATEPRLRGQLGPTIESPRLGLLLGL